jgi:hypothetical protein
VICGAPGPGGGFEPCDLERDGHLVHSAPFGPGRLSWLRCRETTHTFVGTPEELLADLERRAGELLEAVRFARTGHLD